jgi:hypothetical protein
MPIGYQYAVDPEIAGQAAAEGQYGIAAAEQLRYDQRRADALQQSELDRELRYDLAEQQDYRQQQQLGVQSYQADARLGLAYDQLGIESALRDDYQQNQLAQSQMQAEAQMQSQQEATERSRIQQMAQLQRERERQTMDQALAAQTAIMKYPGYTSQQQFDEAVGQWEEQFGMDWGFPQRAIAEQSTQDFSQRRQQFVGGMSQLTGLEPEVIDSFVIEGEGGQPTLLGIRPQDLVGMGEKRMDDQRLRDITAENARAKEELETLKAQLKGDVEGPKREVEQITKQKTLVSQWLKADAKYKAAIEQSKEVDPLTQKPKSPKPMLGSMGFPTISDDEFLLLPEQAIFSDVTGRFYKKVGGVARPIKE